MNTHLKACFEEDEEKRLLMRNPKVYMMEKIKKYGCKFCSEIVQ
jgi:hypothetical protein